MYKTWEGEAERMSRTCCYTLTNVHYSLCWSWCVRAERVCVWICIVYSHRLMLFICNRPTPWKMEYKIPKLYLLFYFGCSFATPYTGLKMCYGQTIKMPKRVEKFATELPLTYAICIFIKSERKKASADFFSFVRSLLLNPLFVLSRFVFFNEK